MAQIGELAVNVTARTKGFTKGIGKAKRTLGGFVKSVRAMGAAMTASMGPIAAALTAFASLAAGITAVSRSFSRLDTEAKVADKLGVAVGSFQALSYAVGQTAKVDAPGLEKALTKLGVGIVDAANGTGLAVDAFKSLGLDAGRLANMGIDEAFLEIAGAMHKVEGPTQRMAVAYDLFGARAADLLTTLDEGAGGIRNLMKERSAMGLTSAEEAAQIQAANDAWSKFKTTLGSVADKIAIEVAPTFESVSHWLTDKAIPAIKNFAGTFQFVMQNWQTIVKASVNRVLLDFLRLFENVKHGGKELWRWLKNPFDYKFKTREKTGAEESQEGFIKSLDSKLNKAWVSYWKKSSRAPQTKKAVGALFKASLQDAAKEPIKQVAVAESTVNKSAPTAATMGSASAAQSFIQHRNTGRQGSGLNVMRSMAAHLLKIRQLQEAERNREDLQQHNDFMGFIDDNPHYMTGAIQ